MLLHVAGICCNYPPVTGYTVTVLTTLCLHHCFIVCRDWKYGLGQITQFLSKDYLYRSGAWDMHFLPVGICL